MQEYKFADIKKDVEAITENTLVDMMQDVRDVKYDANTALQKTEEIAREITKNLQDRDKRFKYNVHVILFQKQDSALAVCSNHLWNPETDGQVVVSYPDILSTKKQDGTNEDTITKNYIGIAIVTVNV